MRIFKSTDLSFKSFFFFKGRNGKLTAYFATKQKHQNKKHTLFMAKTTRGKNFLFFFFSLPLSDHFIAVRYSI